MIRTFNYPLKPTKAQEMTLESWRIGCQRVFNAALECRREAYRKQKKSLTLYDQHKELTELRGADEFYKSVPVQILRSALSRVDLGYKAFFRRVKAGEKPGFPRFRSRDRYDSFGFPKPVIVGNTIVVPKLGAVKFHQYRPVPSGAVIREAKFKKGGDGKWTLSLVLDLGAAPTKIPISSSIGIDVGLESFATLSNGEKIENPRFYRKGQEVLTARSQKLELKKRGSSGRQRAKILVAKAHQHVRNQRLDHVRKVAKVLVSRFDLIAHEDLNIRGMVHGNLAKSIHDASWSQLFHCIACKAEEAGKHVRAVDPRGTSQRCSRCGEVVKKDLSVRIHVCRCGLRMDRDENAAVNIHTLGLSVLEVA